MTSDARLIGLDSAPTSVGGTTSTAEAAGRLRVGATGCVSRATAEGGGNSIVCGTAELLAAAARRARTAAIISGQSAHSSSTVTDRP